MGLKKVLTPAKHWNKDFKPVIVKDVAEMDRRMGDAIADQIEQTRKAGMPLAIILPVGPMGMYKQVVARLKASKTQCDHVTTFNMDEWSDAQGQLDARRPARRIRARDGRGAVRPARQADRPAGAAELRDEDEPADVRREDRRYSKSRRASW